MCSSVRTGQPDLLQGSSGCTIPLLSRSVSTWIADQSRPERTRALYALEFVSSLHACCQAGSLPSSSLLMLLMRAVHLPLSHRSICWASCLRMSPMEQTVGLFWRTTATKTMGHSLFQWQSLTLRISAASIQMSPQPTALFGRLYGDSGSCTVHFQRRCQERSVLTPPSRWRPSLSWRWLP